MDELIIVIDGYINYYNYDRIKSKLNGLSTINYSFYNPLIILLKLIFIIINDILI
ncbi:MAG: IS3 family transposase [Bacilli bacterium]